MSYPQQPYPQQQPHWQGPVPGLAPKQASGGTTITAAILALLSGLVSGFFLVTSLIAIAEYISGAFTHVPFLIGFGGQTISVLLLLLGGILLFARSGAGRFMVVAGAVIKLGLVAWDLIAFRGAVPMGPLSLIGLLLLLITVVAAVLVLLPPTGRYIAAKKKGPQQGFPPPQGPGYPPQQQPYGMPQQYPHNQPPQGYPQSGYGPPPR